MFDVQGYAAVTLLDFQLGTDVCVVEGVSFYCRYTILNRNRQLWSSFVVGPWPPSRLFLVGCIRGFSLSCEPQLDLTTFFL